MLKTTCSLDFDCTVAKSNFTFHAGMTMGQVEQKPIRQHKIHEWNFRPVLVPVGRNWHPCPNPKGFGRVSGTHWVYDDGMRRRT
jgi:hypothetical protein